MSEHAARPEQSGPIEGTDLAPDDPGVVETVQKMPLRRATTLRLTKTALSSLASNRTRSLRLDEVRSLRLEQLRGGYSSQRARLVISGAAGTLVLVSGATSLPASDPPKLSAAAFADLCLTRILAASPSVILLTGISRANYNMSVATAILAAIFLIVAVLMLLGGTPLTDMPAGLAILAVLPGCWLNLRAGRPQHVSVAEMRSEIVRTFIPA